MTVEKTVFKCKRGITDSKQKYKTEYPKKKHPDMFFPHPVIHNAPNFFFMVTYYSPIVQFTGAKNSAHIFKESFELLPADDKKIEN
nr:hypothetical protein [uncultured Eisenbergiella sp.]